MDEKKSTLPSDVHENYSKQYKLVCEICSEYDKENEKDTEEIKKKRFDKLMGLMQKVSGRVQTFVNMLMKRHLQYPRKSMFPACLNPPLLLRIDEIYRRKVWI